MRVYNKTENLLTRMLAVRYVMAFEFFRASTSVFKTVMCCSGVLSAYRAKVVSRLQGAWLNQEFLGQKCTYGDDRALTNFVLREGYHTVYQRTAEVKTLAPPTLSEAREDAHAVAQELHSGKHHLFRIHVHDDTGRGTGSPPSLISS